MIRAAHTLQRIWRGEMHSRSELQIIITLLLAAAGLCFVLCWLYYPAPEDFSVMRDTISNFGKPEKYLDPIGRSFFQLGFALLCILFCICTAYRKNQLHIAPQETVAKTTRLYLGGILCLLLTLYLPDSSEVRIFGIKSRLLHGGAALGGIGLFASAILLDGLMLLNLHLLQRIRHPHAKRKLPVMLYPFIGFAGLFIIALLLIAIWEVRCLFDSELDHWPGDGIYSMPMWEWILFLYFLIYMCLLPQLVRLRSGPRGGLSAIHTWSSGD